MQTGDQGAGPSIAQRRRFRERRVDGISHNPRYQEGGYGEPLIFLPGISGLQITGVHHSLAERYRVIAFDVPRVRETLVGEYADLTQGVATHLGKALRAIGIDSFSLIGSSFGANVALWLAIQQPETVRALILASPTARLGEASATAPAGQSAGLPPEDQLRRQMETLTVPTLVLFGAEDRIVPPEAGRAYKERLPNCYYVLVRDAGHALEDDQPGTFVSLVSDFIDRPGGFTVDQRSALINP